jgi:polyketide biosynthesis enoyl-CoA hydratase PksH
MELSAGAPVRVLPAERGLLRVVLDRPATGNSITASLLDGLDHALDVAEADPSVRIVLLESSSSVFCSGMDLDAAQSSGGGASGGGRAGGGASDPAAGGRRFFELLRRITTTPRLVACHVDGRANGGGVGLVAACDLVFAGESASFALPEALWALLPCCILPFLMRRVGFQPAHRMTLTTLPVERDEALRIHLIDEATSDLTATMRQLARRLQRIDPMTLGDAKRYTARLWPGGAEQEEFAVAEFARLMAAPMARERIASFVEGAVVGAPAR